MSQWLGLVTGKTLVHDKTGHRGLAVRPVELNTFGGGPVWLLIKQVNQVIPKHDLVIKQVFENPFSCGVATFKSVLSIKFTI